MTRPALTADLAARAVAACPGLRITGVMHRTGKSVLFTGTRQGHSVVAKVLTDEAPFWREKFGREAAAYRAFTARPPPFAVPPLHAASTAAGVLVTGRAAGRPAADGRYPAVLAPPAAAALLAAMASVRAWTPPAVLAQPALDYAGRLARYRAAGLLDAADAAALRVLLRRSAGRWEFAHGDARPANVLVTEDGRATLIDWEFAGQYPPGRDLALLWVLLGAIPGARTRIEAEVGADPAVRAGFWTSAATVLIREVRTHRELPAAAPERARLDHLAADWAAVRPVLHRLARDSH